MMMVNTLFDVMLPMYNSTYELAVNINRVIKPRVNSTMFMTTNFLKWDSANEVLTFTGAGHEHLLIYRANEGVCEAVPAGGIALAMAEDISEIVQEKQVVLNDQDVIVLYSDGITEAANVTGELYGLERLKEAVKNYGHLADSLTIFESISTDIQVFVGEEVQNDDMTLMVLRYVKAGFVPEQKESLVSTNWIAG
jgi:serine phosphatase RsbU (regulator of sigma subunit)